MSDQPEVWLFSYGTLRQREVQLAIFGRAVEGRPDALPGYAMSTLKITDPNVIATRGTSEHTIVKRTDSLNDEVSGTAVRITQTELAAADAYEVSDYKRVFVRLRSGIEAHVYVDSRQQS
jgi:hypothetical protein